MDPVAVYLIVGVLVVGSSLAAGFIWLDRRISRRTGTHQIRLSRIGNLALVAVVLAIGIAVVFRQFYPETEIGALLRTERAVLVLFVGCIAILFAIEAFLKWLGHPTAKGRSERDV